jgi:penicillin G amidase
LEGGAVAGQFSKEELRRDLETWDGRAETDSAGLALLVEFRDDLVKAVLARLLLRCREIDPWVKYSWNNHDIPERQIIESGRAALLPYRQKFRDLNSFLRPVLLRSAQKLIERQGAKTLADVRWGDVSKVEMRHPLSGGNALVATLLDMPSIPLSGCAHCVRAASGKHGVTERMAVAPGHDSEGILHMPGGQSGQLFSPHYSDQQRAWVARWPTNFLAGAAMHQLTLKPQS